MTKGHVWPKSYLVVLPASPLNCRACSRSTNCTNVQIGQTARKKSKRAKGERVKAKQPVVGVVCLYTVPLRREKTTLETPPIIAACVLTLTPANLTPLNPTVAHSGANQGGYPS